MTEAIRRVAVVGPGTMGSGIAQVVAASGLPVLLLGRSNESSQKGLARIRADLQKEVQAGRRPPEEKEATLGRLAGGTDLRSVSEADLVIEAVPEDLATKQAVFRELDRICPPKTILASTTSALPIANLASVTDRPDRVIGLHFFNPPPVIEGVEVVKAEATSDETVGACLTFLWRLGKRPTVVRDGPGFVASRLLLAYLVEAARAVEDGQDPRAVDEVMARCCKMPMGPLALIDLIGVDVVLGVLKTLEDAYGARYKPPALLVEMAQEGKLGRKIGEGFFEYSTEDGKKK